MKRLAIAMALGSLMACGGGTPTPPTTPTPPAPANIAGSYDLFLNASPTCSQNLPAATRNLKYIADITQTGTFNTLFIMTLSGDVAFGDVVISGGISGQEVKIATFSISEKTTGGGIALIATGTATVAPDGSMIGTLSGIYQTPSGATCNSTVHQIQMVRR